MDEYVTQASCAEDMAAMESQIEDLERQVQTLVSLGEGVPEIEMELEVSGMTQTPVDKTLSIEDMAADAKAVGDRFAEDELDLNAAQTAIAALQARTGMDIPLTAEPDSPTITEAIDGIISDSYPVGSIYMTISQEAPPFTGTWIEIGITATWSQLKNGKRDYAELAAGDTGGAVHFWLRTL